MFVRYKFFMDFVPGKPIFKKFLIVFFIILITRPCKSQDAERCKSMSTCGQCIAEGPRCAWCSQESYTEAKRRRCNWVENLINTCNDLVNPKTSWKITKDDPLSSSKSVAEEEVIQIKPQEVHIELRPNTPETFSVSFRQARDYPVDLYYVMDLSHSMKDDKDKLAVLGAKFANTMKNITVNFRLGFGSFVDKVAAPYVAMHPQMVSRPCDGCAPPYGFKNHMPLSNETTEFAVKVNEAKVSGNLDSPEGTMDAIMQSIVCKNAIGWREKSRKLLVVTTDNDYHYAGDGKLGGIIEPNDCLCHLDEDGNYAKSTSQDYPSLSQINRVIKDNHVNLIFAVTEDQVDHYRNLSRRLALTTTGKLLGDSSNIVQLVDDQYQQISSSIEMTTDAQDSDNIEFSFSSSCLGEEPKKTNVCKGLKVLDTVTFNVTVKFLRCPKEEKKRNQIIKVYPVGLNENLAVHLKMICECDCEKPENEERKSPKCSSGNGTYECGVCSCDQGKSGDFCQCDGSESSTQESEDDCRRGSETYKCSNRGECRCGKCECHRRENEEEIYYGKYCECSNFDCEKVGNKICNGHGQCDCNECRCHKGWKNSDCSCPTSEQDCKDSNGDVCGGHGECMCGICKCDETHFGRFCDDCVTCSKKCDEYGECVNCALYSKDKELPQEECLACKEMEVHLVDDEIEVNETQKERSCSVPDADGCKISFKYRMDANNKPQIYIQKKKECPAPPNVLAIVSSTTGSIVAAGIILLLMWKLFTTVHDRRELAKFEKERKKAKWDTDVNPLYAPATSTFQNPAYKGGE